MTVSKKKYLSLCMLLCLGIFIFDLATPLDFGVWTLYMIPLLLIAEIARPRLLLSFTGLCIVLIFSRLLLPFGAALSSQFLHRITETSIGVVVVLVLLQRNRAREALQRTNAGLEEAVKERTSQLSVLTARLEEEKTRMERLMEQLPIGIMVGRSPSMEITYTNKHMDEILGMLLATEASVEPYLSVHSDGRRYVLKEWPLHRSLFNNKIVKNEDVSFDRGNGEKVVVRVSSAPLSGDDCFGTQAVAIVRDVTDEKRVEEALRQARNELERRVQERTRELRRAYEALHAELEQHKLMEEEQQHLRERLAQSQKMEAIGTLAGGIAHDFNNMLAVIIGNVELALDDLDERSGARHYIEQTLKASFRARDLVKQILTFSRKTEREKNSLSLIPLLKETYKLLRASLPATVHMNLDVQTESDTIFADPSHIQQVLMNLSTNAAHAMREKGGLLTIGLSDVVLPDEAPVPKDQMRPGPYVKLTVSDTGTGMTDDVRKRIFEPFFTTKKPGEGTGMGLSVVYGIVKSYGGSISVMSEPGEGSTFEILFPLAPVSPKVQEAEQQSVPVGQGRVLFVDDEPAVVEMASRMLRRLGYDVTTALNGSRAWEIFQESPNQFDLVVTDQVMPDITGLTLAKKMLKARADLPIILCTGFSETVSEKKAREVGIKAFLMKPLTMYEVGDAIRQVLDGKKPGKLPDS
jgi:PAS domain S-box-containing protein